MIIEYLKKEKLINDELDKIINNKNEFTSEFIREKVHEAVNIIIDIDTKINKLKPNNFKKIYFSILKIFTFGKINKNKIMEQKINFLWRRKENILKNLKKINELYIRKSNKNIELEKIKKEINSKHLENKSSKIENKQNVPKI
ncbi:hypothetical protein [Spiroplasma endosymbiont of Acasis viretata]|uniref:hypothetical protein n=1 Tax=Spiroplasma endosymbiont of Acasis viretata TaxID=3066306 RepID=UPI00313EF9B7